MGAVADEDCRLTLDEAKREYNAGNYSKAKSLFDYVNTECNGYGDAASWSRKCGDAMTPKLTVSKTSISVGASSGSTYVTVESNRTWELRNTSSSMFSVSKSGNKININYYSNTKTSSRSDYFDVVTTDGSKSVRVTVRQSASSNNSPFLTVSQTSISAPASGSTYYLDVSSNRTWEVQYPSGDMYSVTRNGNSLTVQIKANPNTTTRTDYFNVKTTDGDKVQKISLSQSGKSSSSSSSYATIQNAWIDHNVYSSDGKKGMKIHVKFDAYDVYNHKIKVCTYYYYKNGSALNGITNSNYITNNGKVTSQLSATANYTNTTWNDFVVFMPYSYLNMPSGCKNVNLEVQIGIYDDTTDKWLTKTNKVIDFTFSN